MERFDAWTARLSDYLDGELAADEREALEAHLARCQECVDTLVALREVVDGARRLEDRLPATDLWPAIAARIGAQTGEPSRPPIVTQPPRASGGAVWLRSFARPRRLAAGIAFVLAAGTVWWIRPPGDAVRPDATSAPVAAPAVPSSGVVHRVADVGDAGYAAAVADLERTLREERGRLDPETVEVLERNLEIIDRAIAEARRAVAADPAKQYLNRHLAENMRRKLELLRRATMIVSAQS